MGLQNPDAILKIKIEEKLFDLFIDAKIAAPNLRAKQVMKIVGPFLTDRNFKYSKESNLRYGSN